MNIRSLLVVAALAAPLWATAGADIPALAASKGAKAAIQELSKGDENALRFLERVKTCSRPDLRTAMSLYKQSVDASVIPLLATALNAAVSVCAMDVLQPLSAAQIREVCSAYFTFVEDDVADESKNAAHYASQSRALGRVASALGEKATVCRDSQRLPASN